MTRLSREEVERRLALEVGAYLRARTDGAPLEEGERRIADLLSGLLGLRLGTEDARQAGWSPYDATDGLVVTAVTSRGLAAIEVSGEMFWLGRGGENPWDPFLASLSLGSGGELSYTLRFGSRAHGLGGFPAGSARREQLALPGEEPGWAIVLDGASRADSAD